MRKLFGGALAVALICGATAAGAQNVTMRVSHQVPTAHHLHKMLEGFAADVQQRAGNGLLGLRERLRQCGGQLSLQDAPDGGLVLAAHIPLHLPETLP